MISRSSIGVKRGGGIDVVADVVDAGNDIANNEEIVPDIDAGNNFQIGYDTTDGFVESSHIYGSCTQ